MILALVALLITSLQVALTWRFRKRKPAIAAQLPFISILKPVCGLDDELEENLLSFVRLEGIRYEVIVSAEEWDDPALEVAGRAKAS